KKKKKQVVLDEVEDAPQAPVEPISAPAKAEESAPAVEEEAIPEATGSGAATPAEDASGAPAVDDGDLFADMKKKKKKKKEIPLDLVSDSAAVPDGLDVPIKKKKSRKPAEDFAKELDELEAENEDGAAGGEDGDLGDDVFEKANGDGEAGKEAWVLEGRDPTYPELLNRFFSLLHAHNPELAGEKRKYTIVPPQVAREGTKKTVFSNLTDICRRMHRQPEHVIQFLYSELGTQGSIDGAQRLVMKGRYTQKQIENVLRKYIVEYVTCKICKSADTLLGKENRLYFMTCETCGSRRSVSAIKAGYQAQGKRIK
ncbi:domain found in IF2B/IF5-domain-containing protein, partial [Kockovaella imperatae]